MASDRDDWDDLFTLNGIKEVGAGRKGSRDDFSFLFFLFFFASLSLLPRRQVVAAKKKEREKKNWESATCLF